MIASVRLLLPRDRIVELLGDAQLLDGHGDLGDFRLEIDHSPGLVASLLQRLASQLREQTTKGGRKTSVGKKQSRSARGGKGTQLALIVALQVGLCRHEPLSADAAAASHSSPLTMNIFATCCMYGRDTLVGPMSESRDGNGVPPCTTVRM